MEEQDLSPQEVTQETQASEAPPSSDTDTSSDDSSSVALESQEQPQLSLAERIAKNAEKVAAAQKAAEGKKPATPATPKTPATPTPGQPPVPGALPTDTPAAYQPNFKYKFAVEGGQSQEAEFPEYLKGVIKTKDQEDEIRTVFAKAKGLDFVKPRFERLRTAYQDVNNAHGLVMKGLEEVKAHYNRGDFDSFFARLQIPQERVLQWVLDKVNYAELPPEQRALYDSRREADRRAWEAETRLQALEGRSVEATQTAKHLALDASLTRPDISSVATAFDERARKPGAFREAVRSFGELEWYRSQGKVDLSPDQAIQAVIAQYGLSPAAPAAPAPGTLQGQPAAPAAPQVGGTITPPAATTPVIPNVSGRANTPVAGKPRPKNLADLRRLSKEMAQAQ